MAFARERGLGGPAFTSLNLGGFVAWELYPSALVFQDAIEIVVRRSGSYGALAAPY